jgi:hypothetical protein
VRVDSVHLDANFSRASRVSVLNARQLLTSATENQKNPYPKGRIHVSKTESEWKTYRCRFLIRAKKLSRSLAFVDALGREHRGKKGDYLVESANGAQRIWPRQLFEDAHVLFDSADAPRLPEISQASSQSSSAPPKKGSHRETIHKDSIHKETTSELCGKASRQPGIPAVNCVSYNM